MGHAFSDDLKCFYELGRGIAQSQGMLSILQDTTDNSLQHRRMIREKLYPSILSLVKNCEVKSPPFSMKLDEKIDDRDYYDFIFDLQEAIEIQLTRRVKQETDRAKARKSRPASSGGTNVTYVPGNRASKMSAPADARHGPRTEAEKLRGQESHDIPVSELTNAESGVASPSYSNARSQSQMLDQPQRPNGIKMPESSHASQQFKDLDSGMEICGVHVPVEGILKRVLVELCSARHSVKDAQLRRLTAKRAAKKPSTPGIRSTRLTELRKILRTAFKLSRNANPVPEVEKSDPPEWMLDWQLLRTAARSLRPAN